MDTLSIAKAIAAGSLLALSACASGPSVRPQLAQTAGAVRAAEEVGAQDVPEAALHLKYASSELEQGRALVDKGEDDRARRALERAELDAELALALVKRNRAQAELHRVDSELSEMNTKLSE